jgi:hypothetical protein
MVVRSQYYVTTLGHFNPVYADNQFTLNYHSNDPNHIHTITIRQLFPELKTKYSVASKTLFLNKKKLHLTRSKYGSMDYF